ncbi:MAG: AAA family ATPase [Solirubrobacterales bacterium]
MKVAVAGKGGAGKTTVSGMIARTLARSGRTVLALDADVNPMLGISLGVGPEETERLAGIRQALDGGKIEHAESAEAVVERFGADAPDGVRLIVASRVDGLDSGCACCGVTPDALLVELDDAERAVICDLEAGIGTLTKMKEGSVDLVLVVTNPTPKSIEVARRAAKSAAAKEARVMVIANRVQSDEDRDVIRSALGSYEIVEVPEDSAVARADRDGVAPIDVDGDAPGIGAMRRLGERLPALAS